ncbi:alkaline phosphatase PhoX [Kineosporia sp. R_H_3]|uniref:alkaline phosphatase PhoX n=1 Tax=Kineosporia sp. R_H_3 TaxID=1961848 RepID=UPI000B4B71EF|nr:alkaline phosphatase PhoX [Kineosporia sp. R_H_3]
MTQQTPARSRRTRAVLAGTGLGCAALVVPMAAPASAAGSTAIGPTGGIAPYVLPVAPDVTVTSLLTVNNGAAKDGTQLVGIPDGIGAYRSGKRVVALVNAELGATAGIARAHGQKGAFVSRWTIDPKTLAVTTGSDLVQPGVRYWDYTTGAYAAAPVAPAGAAAGTHTAAFNRFCSGYLAPAGSLYNDDTDAGYDGAIYMANEEAGDEGRVFGVTTDGAATQLPRLGLFSWENTVSAANRTDTTVVMGNEDGGNGQLRVYVGTKTTKGSPVERAGLTNGSLFVVDTADESVSTDAQFRTAYGKGKAVPVTFGAGEQVDTTASGAAQNADAAAKGLTLNRIEDGSFDPRNRNDYYFLTTEGGSTAANPAEPGVSRDGGGLWRLRFTNVDKPELGGTLTLLLDGSEAPYLSKPDNMAIDRRGNLLVQEDPGGNDHVARILAYRIKDGRVGVVAGFDTALFGVTNPAGTTPDTRAVLTTDEESSGIVDTADLFGKGTFLFDAQVHTKKNLPAGTGAGTVEELVENGQILLLEVGDWDAVYRR